MIREGRPIPEPHWHEKIDYFILNDLWESSPDRLHLCNACLRHCEISNRDRTRNLTIEDIEESTYEEVSAVTPYDGEESFIFRDHVQLSLQAPPATDSQNEEKTYVFCQTCNKWADYDDYKAVSTKAKTCPVEYEAHSYSSQSQQKYAHKPCQGRWIVGDVGLVGKITGHISLKYKGQELTGWKSYGQCAGPNWNYQIVVPKHAVFMIDASTNHEGLHLNRQTRTAAIAIRILVRSTPRGTNTSRLDPKDIIFVNIADIAYISPQMKNFFEKMFEFVIDELKIAMHLPELGGDPDIEIRYL